jgi:hypothetical protein
MWQQVNSVYVEAERCQKHHKDENGTIKSHGHAARATYTKKGDGNRHCLIVMAI